MSEHRAARTSCLFFSIGAVLHLAFWYSDGVAQTLPQEIDPSNAHCSVMQGTPDNQAFACQVWDKNPERFSAPLQLEVYRQGEKVLTIEPGRPILEWHFWNDGKQLAVRSGIQGGSDSYFLCDTATAIQVDQAPGSLTPSRLPQWAKSRSQIDDESVPESATLTQQRNLWLAKVLRQLNTIHPGMTRKALSSILTTEGGISTRFQRTYVSRVCPYIKVSIRFKAADGNTDAPDEEPGDIIESVSGPYLGWGVHD